MANNSQAENPPSKITQENVAADTLAKVEFKFTGKFKEGKAVFKFVNNSADTIGLYSYFPPKDHWFYSHFVDYEVLDKSVWKKLDVGYDGAGHFFDFPPKEEASITISLAPLSRYAGATCRVSMGKIKSESFVAPSHVDDH